MLPWDTTHKAESLVSTWVPKWLGFRHCNGKELAPRGCPWPIILHSSVKEEGEHMWRDSSPSQLQLTPNWKPYKASGVLTNAIYNSLNWCQRNSVLFDRITSLSSCSVALWAKAAVNACSAEACVSDSIVRVLVSICQSLYYILPLICYLHFH